MRAMLRKVLVIVQAVVLLSHELNQLQIWTSEAHLVVLLPVLLEPLLRLSNYSRHDLSLATVNDELVLSQSKGTGPVLALEGMI